MQQVRSLTLGGQLSQKSVLTAMGLLFGRKKQQLSVAQSLGSLSAQSTAGGLHTPVLLVSSVAFPLVECWQVQQQVHTALLPLWLSGNLSWTTLCPPLIALSFWNYVSHGHLPLSLNNAHLHFCYGGGWGRLQEQAGDFIQRDAPAAQR